MESSRVWPNTNEMKKKGHLDKGQFYKNDKFGKNL